MNRVAIFGNAGAGKSTLARQLANATDLPLYALDKIKYLPGGAELPHQHYLQQHAQILEQERWLIDGFGCVASAWQRFAAADTLIYIDLPLWQHVWWVTKRLFKGVFVNPEGWPDNSPIIKSTLNSYRVLWLCHRKLTPAYRKLIIEQQATKQVFHLKSAQHLKQFIGEYCRKT